MKFYIIISIILFSSKYCDASSLTELTKCLGQEESHLHKKKDTGPIYKLNQKMIADLIQLPSSVSISTDIYQAICHNEKHSAALTLLKHLLLDQQSPLVGQTDRSDLVKRNMDMHLIEEIRNESYDTFLKLLADIQSQVDNPKCLQNNFPELTALYEKIKYWQEERGLIHLMQNKNDLYSFFEKFGSTNFKLKDCISKK